MASPPSGGAGSPPGSPPAAGHGAIQGQNSSAKNTLQPPGPSAFLRLRFKDAENASGEPRDFPKGLPVRVRFTDGAARREDNFNLTAQGNLHFQMAGAANLPWRNFTLLFPGSENEFIVCEPAGAGAPTSLFATQATLNTAASPPASPPGATKRFFRLPNPQGPAGATEIWSLKHSDWAVGTGGVPNATFTASTGVFQHNSTVPANAPDIGSGASPVILILDPHWKFFRFVFFDRFFGPPAPTSGSPPRASHGRRISIPAIPLEGFRAAASPPAADPFATRADTLSNWITGGDARDVVQCLPWIVQHDNGAGSLPDLTGATMALRFKNSLSQSSFISSDSDTVRRIVGLAPSAAQLKAGPNRLKLYDLPRVWKSRRYYTRGLSGSPPADGKFFQDLTQGDVAQADGQSTPLIFCLDDMVLYAAPTGGGDPTPLAALPATDKMAIFNHRFDTTALNCSAANCTAHGLYQPQDPAGAPGPLELPYSNVQSRDNYLFDYVDWTRMVIAQGNVFDVFDRRTPDSNDPNRVVGARAAVRWIDATAALPGIQTATVLPGNVFSAWTNTAPAPGRALWGDTPRVNAPSGDPTFSMQPYFSQRSPRIEAPFNVANDDISGRCDMVLLRCCDVDGDGDEVAVNLQYIRSFLNFNYTPPATSPPASPPASPPKLSRLAIGPQKQYAQDIGINVAARWNGNDAANSSRAQVLPRTASPPRRLKTNIVMFCQSVPLARAHFNLGLVPPGGRDFRESQLGGGETAEGSEVSQADLWFTAAHETGHMNTFPDEYNERWEAFSYDQLSFHARLPGDPYEADGRNETGTVPEVAMMLGNKRIRNRYFWHAAQWVRQITSIPMRVRYKDLSGTVYDQFSLPDHPQAGRTYYQWPFAARVNANAFCDLFLYRLGKERYSENTLQLLATQPGPASVSPPSGSPPGTFTFDGILVVVQRIECTLPGDPNLQVETTNRQKITATIAAKMRLGMDYRFFATGDTGAPTQHFDHCLVRFAPQVVVTNFPNYGPAQSPPAPLRTVAGNTGIKDLDPAGAIAIRTAYGVTSHVVVNNAAPVQATWNAGNSTLTMNVQNVNDIQALLDANFLQLLGINKTMAAVTAADLQPTVRLVFPGAAVNHL